MDVAQLLNPFAPGPREAGVVEIESEWTARDREAGKEASFLAQVSAPKSGRRRICGEKRGREPGAPGSIHDPGLATLPLGAYALILVLLDWRGFRFLVFALGTPSLWASPLTSFWLRTES